VVPFSFKITSCLLLHLFWIDSTIQRYQLRAFIIKNRALFNISLNGNLPKEIILEYEIVIFFVHCSIVWRTNSALQCSWSTRSDCQSSFVVWTQDCEKTRTCPETRDLLKVKKAIVFSNDVLIETATTALLQPVFSMHSFAGAFEMANFVLIFRKK